jgi:hypothetical protein
MRSRNLVRPSSPQKAGERRTVPFAERFALGVEPLEHDASVATTSITGIA